MTLSAVKAVSVSAEMAVGSANGPVAVLKECQQPLDPERAHDGSAIFSPLHIAGGRITLSHRLIMAPMTRNRGAPLYLEEPNRHWCPDDLAVTYYSQRATPGGLIVTEGIPPNLEGNGTPGVPGLFHDLQTPGWRKIVEAVHHKGGHIYAQLWHAGRSAMPCFTGYSAAVCPSATPFQGDHEARYPPPDETGNPGSGERLKYRDFPPREMTQADIDRTISDYVTAAKRAMDDCGFDGVEIHAANGYLIEQFLNTNINRRQDKYGGSIESYCRFALELMSAVAKAIGGSNVAIRLTPFGLFNQTKGELRNEIWSHLCKSLKAQIPDLSYIHFIEPRYEQIIDAGTKNSYLASLGSEISLKKFRNIMGSTPFFVAGGYDASNIWDAFESGHADAVALGRLFLSNPDLVERLQKGISLNQYDRNRFYWVPWPDRAKGYTDYPLAEQ